MNLNSKIYVAGHRGLIGSAIIRKLKAFGYNNIVYRTHEELDLVNQQKVDDFFLHEKIEYVFLSAAKVGGIYANSHYPADFAYQNLSIQNNIIFCSWKYKVKKLLFLGSTCIYPRESLQPIKEDYLLNGPLEESNRAYAIAKIAGIVTCQSFNLQYKTNFICVMPTNLYGPNDNYHPDNSHVLPGLLRRFHEAKIYNYPEVIIWGTGKPLREFLYSDDAADACVFLMNNYNSNDIINLGTGEEIAICQLVEIVKNVVKYEGALRYDCSKPDGTPRKLVDCSKISKLGWKHSIDLHDGISLAYEDFKNSERNQTLRNSLT
jgi:GDP-L-fucose synthase